MTSVLAVLAGIALLFVILQDAFEVMLLPRRVQRNLRLVRLYFRSIWAVWARVGAYLPAGARRERFLSVFGALSMVLLFAIWAGALIFGFALGPEFDEGAAVVLRRHLDESGERRLPVLQQHAGAGAPGEQVVALDQDAQALGVKGPDDSAAEDALAVHAPLAIACWRGRASVNLLVNRAEAKQLAEKLRYAMKKRDGRASEAQAAH